MDDLKKTFDKEPKGKKAVLVAAAVALIATFLPWFSSWGYSSNGWQSFGFLTVVASIALILMWLLPKVGVKFKLPAKEDVLEKGLSIAMLAGPVLLIFETNSNLQSLYAPQLELSLFSFIGFGLYIALAAGAVAVYFSFMGGKKKAGSTVVK